MPYFCLKFVRPSSPGLTTITYFANVSERLQGMLLLSGHAIKDQGLTNLRQKIRHFVYLYGFKVQKTLKA